MILSKSSSRKTSLKETPVFSSQAATYLKGIAIVMMLIHHCFLNPERYEGQALCFLLPEHYLNYIALFFKICVCLFVFISAYGISLKTNSLQNISLPELMHSVIIPRLIKLLANFMFVFILVDIFAFFYDPARFSQIYSSTFPDAIGYYLLDLFGLAELFDTPTFLATYWYYSLAILIVFLTPLFCIIIRKTGSAFFLILIAIITFTLSFKNPNVYHYLLCIATGAVCSSSNFINRWMRFSLASHPLKNALLKFVLEAACLFLLMLFRESALKNELIPIWDSLIPVVFTCFCCEFIFILPVLPKILQLLGKHSANIFLIHNYIRAVWFYDYTYHFKYPVLIVAVLLAESLILSFIIELLKKFSGFYKHTDAFIAHCRRTK